MTEYLDQTIEIWDTNYSTRLEYEGNKWLDNLITSNFATEPTDSGLQCELTEQAYLKLFRTLLLNIVYEVVNLEYWDDIVEICDEMYEYLTHRGIQNVHFAYCVDYEGLLNEC